MPASAEAPGNGGHVRHPPGPQGALQRPVPVLPEQDRRLHRRQVETFAEGHLAVEGMGTGGFEQLPARIEIGDPPLSQQPQLPQHRPLQPCRRQRHRLQQMAAARFDLRPHPGQVRRHFEGAPAGFLGGKGAGVVQQPRVERRRHLRVDPDLRPFEEVVEHLRRADGRRVDHPKRAVAHISAVVVDVGEIAPDIGAEPTGRPAVESDRQVCRLRITTGDFIEPGQIGQPAVDLLRFAVERHLFLQPQQVRIHRRSASERIRIGVAVGDQDNMVGGFDSSEQRVHNQGAIIEYLPKYGVSSGGYARQISDAPPRRRSLYTIFTHCRYSALIPSKETIP